LVLDSFWGHLNEDVKKKLQRGQTDMVVSPGGVTSILQGVAERTPRFGRGIASGGERVVEQRCTCRFQCTPWRGQENIELLLLRSL
jgi:predicted transcriptional regulator